MFQPAWSPLPPFPTGYRLALLSSLLPNSLTARCLEKSSEGWAPGGSTRPYTCHLVPKIHSVRNRQPAVFGDDRWARRRRARHCGRSYRPPMVCLCLCSQTWRPRTAHGPLVLRFSRSLSRFETQDIKTQPQINHYVPAKRTVG